MQPKVLMTCVMGLLISLRFAPAVRADEGKEENEKKVQFADLPMAVRKTFKREANGSAIKAVDVEKVSGKTVYEADVIIGGTNYEILVNKSGLLISKKIDNEDEEKDSKATAKSKKPSKEEADEDDDKASSKSAKAGKSSKAREEDEEHDKPSAAKAKSGKSGKVEKEDDEDDAKPAKAAAKSGKSSKVEKAEEDDDDKPGSTKAKPSKPAKVQKDSKDDDDKE